MESLSPAAGIGAGEQERQGGAERGLALLARKSKPFTETEKALLR
ncbi:hypothetical protein [Streptomyces celluloflavus]